MNYAFELFDSDPPARPVCLSIPHSGRRYPEYFIANSRLGRRALRVSEDAYVDQLFRRLSRFGFGMLVARLPRAFVDLNRAAAELDGALIRDLQKPSPTARVAAGLGVIPRVVGPGQPIRAGKIPQVAALGRLRRIYKPYHQQLASMIAARQTQFGQAILLDCHSAPASSLPKGADIVLGDCYGRAASPLLVDRLQRQLEFQGMRVMRNTPFAGGHITENYGRPGKQAHVIQIEINRSLYMNESRIEKHADFDDFAANISKSLIGFADSVWPDRAGKIAAE